MLEKYLLGVTGLKRNLTSVLGMAQSVRAKGMAYAVVRPSLVPECLSRVPQESVPLVIGVHDWKVQFLNAQPSQTVVTHLDEAPHLGLCFLGLKDHLVVLPIKIAAPLAAAQSPRLGRSDAAEKIQGQQGENFQVLLTAKIQNLPALLYRQDIRIKRANVNLLQLEHWVLLHHVLPDQPVEQVLQVSAVIPHGSPAPLLPQRASAGEPALD